MFKIFQQIERYSQNQDWSKSGVNQNKFTYLDREQDN